MHEIFFSLAQCADCRMNETTIPLNIYKVEFSSDYDTLSRTIMQIKEISGRLLQQVRLESLLGQLSSQTKKLIEAKLKLEVTF